MATKYLLKTPNADNTIDVANQIASQAIEAAKIADHTITADQIAAGTITGAELSSSLSLPSATTLDGSAIALQSSLDAAIKGMTPKGSVRGFLDAPSLAEAYMSYDHATLKLTATLSASINDLGPGGLSDYATSDRLLINFGGLDAKFSGIYSVTTVGVTNTAATGSLFTPPSGGGAITEHDTFTVSDGLNTPTVFEFLLSGSSLTDPANVPVTYSAGMTAAQVALAIQDAFNTVGESLKVRVSSIASNVVNLVNTRPASGATGNVAITQSGSSLLGVSGMSGGANDGTPFVLTRAENFDEEAEIVFGSYVVILEGDLANQIYYQQTPSLGANKLDVDPITFVHWGEAATSYTAGNGISISGGNEISAKLKSAGGLEFSGAGNDEISVKVAASNALVKDGGSGELSVRTASEAQTGVITAQQYKDLTRTTAASDVGTIDTQDDGTNGFSLASVEVPEKSVGIYTLSMNSVNDTNDGWCVRQIKFALRREMGDRVLVGNPLVVFNEHTAGFGGITVDITLGVSGPDSITVGGINGEDIRHFMSVTVLFLTNTPVPPLF